MLTGSEEENALVIEKFKWERCHQLFYGSAYSRPSDVDEALKLASECPNNPDAQWLVSLFPFGIHAPEFALQVLSGVDIADDKRYGLACHFAWQCVHSTMPMERELAEGLFDHAVRCGHVRSFFCRPRRVPYRNLMGVVEPAAVAGDCVCMSELGLIYLRGRGCEQDQALGFYWLERAAREGSAAAAMLFIDEGLNWRWWNRYTWYGDLFQLVLDPTTRRNIAWDMSGDLYRLFKQKKSRPFGRAIFEAGRVWTRIISVSDAVSGIPCLRGDKTLLRAGDKYQKWTKRARRAVKWWLLIARRVGIVKDMRLYIGTILWKDAFAWCRWKKGAIPP